MYLHRLDRGLQINVGVRHALERVLWIGGAPDSGKTSIARLLAQRHDVDVYHFDRHEMNHFSRADLAATPDLWAAHPDRMTTEERWLGSSPEEMARSTIASWSERCRMAFDDIAALPGTAPLIAEGPGFFPSLLTPILTDTRKAIWLVPSEEFKRQAAAARGKPGNRHETSDPNRASVKIIERDLLMGDAIQQACGALGLTCLKVDGAESVDALAALVEARFEPWLTTADAAGTIARLSGRSPRESFDGW